jgi:hypothetical protein
VLAIRNNGITPSTAKHMLQLEKKRPPKDRKNPAYVQYIRMLKDIAKGVLPPPARQQMLEEPISAVVNVRRAVPQTAFARLGQVLSLFTGILPTTLQAYLTTPKPVDPLTNAIPDRTLLDKALAYAYPDDPDPEEERQRLEKERQRRLDEELQQRLRELHKRSFDLFFHMHVPREIAQRAKGLSLEEKWAIVEQLRPDLAR